MQYKAETIRATKVTSTLLFWKNEYGEVDMDTVDMRDLRLLLTAMSNGHEIDCDRTGEEVE
jgi:hypothetical protein